MMPPVIHVDQIDQFVGQVVSIKGWVYNRTDKGKLVFLLVRDGYGFVQCVAFKNDLPAELFDQISHIPQESSQGTSILSSRILMRSSVVVPSASAS